MKIAICGDSISEGIGSLKINYQPLLQEKFKNVEIKNFAHTGSMINHMDQIELNIRKFDPDILILFYGNVDAMTRPKSKSVFYRFLPNRYRKNGMLSPRALFTRRFFVRGFQKIESLFRICLNKLLIKICGYEVWMTVDKFEEKYTEVLKKYSGKNIILISTVPVYEKWFPHTNEQYVIYNKIIKELSEKNGCEFINAYDILSKYEWDNVFLADRFHLSQGGYEVIAEEISKAICKKISC